MLHRILGHVRHHAVAWVALFFALSGGALAANNYIRSTDTIPSGSDLVGSTYGSPLIASGKVTNGKLADGSVTTSKFDPSAQAPDAAKLGGLDPSDYSAVLSGRINGLTTALGGVDYGAASGLSTASATEANVTTLSPDHDLVVRDLSIQVTAAPGTDQERGFRLLVNGSPVIGCIVIESETSCTSSGPGSVPANSTLSIKDAAGGTGAPAADARFGFRLTP